MRETATAEVPNIIVTCVRGAERLTVFQQSEPRRRFLASIALAPGGSSKARLDNGAAG
jgi:hypothetical protein